MVMMLPLADAAVNHFVEVVDVDGVVRRIDINAVIQRIDINALVERIDIDKNVVQRIDIDKNVIQRINWNQVLSDIDWNQNVMNNIDWDNLMKRIDTSSLIARSSSGVFQSCMDTLRTQLVVLDLSLWIFTRCRIWTKKRRMRCYLPPSPGRHRQRDDRQVYPKGRSNKAIAVQGRYCGFLSKTIAIMIDMMTIFLSFGLLFRMIQLSLVLFFFQTNEEAADNTDNFRTTKTIIVLAIYGMFWFLYFFLTIWLVGQTFGMMWVGLRVCNCNRRSPYAPVLAKQAFFRTCLLPITLFLCPPLGVIGLIRRDGRMVHDLVSKTGMIYLWDAKLAQQRYETIRREDFSSRTSITDDDDDDSMDDIILGSDSEEEDDNDFEKIEEGQEVLLRSTTPRYRSTTSITTSSSDDVRSTGGMYATFA